MGMFDSFIFETGALPDNREPPETEFQTKDLACQLDKYRVDKYGTVKRFSHNEIIYYPEPINDAAYIYSIEMEKDSDGSLKKDGWTREQMYKIVIVDSKVAFIEKLQESGY